MWYGDSGRLFWGRGGKAWDLKDEQDLTGWSKSAKAQGLGKQDWKKARVASASNEVYLTGNSQTFQGLIGHFKDFILKTVRNH